MRLVIFSLAFLTALVASAQKTDISQVDAILDRLERRLLDQEAEGLTFDEKNWPSSSESEIESSQKHRFPKKSIEPRNSKSQQFDDVAQLVRDLEQQVEQLASNVQKTKQTIIDDAAINNFISLEAVLPDTDKASIKSIEIRLDGFKLYKIDDAAGLWIPSKSIPLYSGPLQPGNHRLDVEARISIRDNKSLPVNSTVYRFLNKSFPWSIPDGHSNSRYRLTIIPSDKLDGNVDANLQESP